MDIINGGRALMNIRHKLNILNVNLKYIDPFIHSFAINFKITYEIDNKFYPFCHNYDVNIY